MSENTVRVWRVSGPCVSNELDYVITDDLKTAGHLAAEAAELAWDEAAERDPFAPGPPVTIQCYEMPREEYDELETEE